jgi:hypothetical protein
LLVSAFLGEKQSIDVGLSEFVWDEVPFLQGSLVIITALAVTLGQLHFFPGHFAVGN